MLDRPPPRSRPPPGRQEGRARVRRIVPVELDAETLPPRSQRIDPPEGDATDRRAVND
jgi:hypothetical protein